MSRSGCVGRVRPEPAVPSFLPEAARGRRPPPPALPVFPLPALLFRAVRGMRGRDRGIERGLRDARGQRSLGPVGIDHLRQPAQRRCRRRDPRPRPRGHPAAVPATETSDSRTRTGSGAAPAGKWRRMHSASHDAPAGVVLSCDDLSGLAPGSSPRAAPSHQAHPCRDPRVSRKGRPPAQAQLRKATAAPQPQRPPAGRHKHDCQSRTVTQTLTNPWRASPAKMTVGPGVVAPGPEIARRRQLSE